MLAKRFKKQDEPCAYKNHTEQFSLTSYNSGLDTTCFFGRIRNLWLH